MWTLAEFGILLGCTVVCAATAGYSAAHDQWGWAAACLLAAVVNGLCAASVWTNR